MNVVDALQIGLDADRVELIYLRGFMYLNGIGVNGYIEPDAQAARQYFLAAAERGLSIAQLAIGSMLMGDYGGEPNMQEAVRWLSAAADQGHTNAMKMLAILNFELSTTETPIDVKTAISWLEKAVAEGRDALALLMLGDIYFEGRGVEKDEKRGVEYFEQAAKLGDDGAHKKLADIYSKGTGSVAENFSLHIFHWEEADRLRNIRIERLKERKQIFDAIQASRQHPA